MLRRLVLFTLTLLFASAAQSHTPTTLSVPADSPRWDLEEQAKAVEYQGRKCLLLDGGAAVLKDFEMRDGVIDVDVATPAKRGFFGIQFRLADDGANGEWVYLRQHKSGLPDAMQYTPILNTGANWQIYNGPGFTGAVDIPKDVWFHLRLEVVGAQAKLYVKDMDKPALVMNDLKSGVQKGQVALYVLTGATYFSNFEVRTTPDAPWERHLPPMPPGHSDQVEPIAILRCAGTQSGASAFALRERCHTLAGRGSRAARLCGPLSLSRGPASEGHVSDRLFDATGTAAGNEGTVCADQHRFRPRPSEKALHRL